MQRKHSVIITMAGDSTRFRERGYGVPKFMVSVRGRSLFDWSLSSLRYFLEARPQVIFAVRHDHHPERFLREHCARLQIQDYQILYIDQVTDGQATTALLTGELIRDRTAPCLIYNIDTYVEPEALLPQSIRGAGWIPCFPGQGDAWSFVRAQEDGRVLEVREKERISAEASVGLYWFESFESYSTCYLRHYTSWESPAERYIAPMYNTLIASDRAVYRHQLPAGVVHPLGTPEQVETFAHGG